MIVHLASGLCYLKFAFGRWLHIPSCVSLGKWERLEHDCVLGKRAFVVCFCENIPTWISLSGDLAFSHQDGIYGLELSQAKTSLYSLYLHY